jgi:hypothetical protein
MEDYEEDRQDISSEKPVSFLLHETYFYIGYLLRRALSQNSFFSFSPGFSPVLCGSADL